MKVISHCILYLHVICPHRFADGVGVVLGTVKNETIVKKSQKLLAFSDCRITTIVASRGFLAIRRLSCAEFYEFRALQLIVNVRRRFGVSYFTNWIQSRLLLIAFARPTRLRSWPPVVHFTSGPFLRRPRISFSLYCWPVVFVYMYMCFYTQMTASMV